MFRFGTPTTQPAIYSAEILKTAERNRAIFPCGWAGFEWECRTMESPGHNKPLTEPELIQCVYLTGAEIADEHGVFRFVGWVDEDGERRVRIRFAIPMDIAREIHAEFRRRFLERNH